MGGHDSRVGMVRAVLGQLVLGLFQQFVGKLQLGAHPLGVFFRLEVALVFGRLEGFHGVTGLVQALGARTGIARRAIERFSDADRRSISGLAKNENFLALLAGAELSDDGYAEVLDWMGREDKLK